MLNFFLILKEPLDHNRNMNLFQNKTSYMNFFWWENKAKTFKNKNRKYKRLRQLSNFKWNWDNTFKLSHVHFLVQSHDAFVTNLTSYPEQFFHCDLVHSFGVIWWPVISHEKAWGGEKKQKQYANFFQQTASNRLSNITQHLQEGNVSSVVI